MGALIFCAVLLVLAAVSVLTRRWRGARMSRRAGAPGTSRIAAFTGGIWVPEKNFHASSVVRLELFSWGVRLRGTGIGLMVPAVWEFRYQELRSVQEVSGPHCQGVRFLTSVSPVEVFFWNSLPGQVLVRLQQHGAPVVPGVLPMEDPPYYLGRWAR